MKREPTGQMMRARGVYRRWLLKRFERISLAGLAPDDEPLFLREIYVPLLLAPHPLSETEEEQKIHKLSKPLTDWLDPQPPPVVSNQSSALGRRLSLDLHNDSLGKEAPTLARLHHRMLLISGEAGSGKTMLTQAVVNSLTGTGRDDFNRKFEGIVPIPLQLRNVPADRLDDLEALVDWWLGQVEPEKGDSPFDPAALRAFLDHSDAIFLFDGLDELGTVERRRIFLKALRGHRWLFGEQANLALLTGRPTGFESVEKSLPPGRRLHVAPFSKEQIQTYLEKWFVLRPMRTPDEWQEAVENLMSRLNDEDQKIRILAMARRPAYLSALAFIHGTRGRLPDTRADLYELIVDAYLEILDQKRKINKEGRIWSRQDKLLILSTVAFLAHERATQGSLHRVQSDCRFEWSFKELLSTVRHAIEASAGSLRDLDIEEAESLTRYFIARTGLLAETREGVYQFAHLSFQEYLAALFLVEQASATSDKVEFLQKNLLEKRLARPSWQEVALLALAIDATRTQNRGQRAILAELDLARENHFDLLVQVLSGRELRLTKEERRAWVVAWFAYAAACGRPVSAQELSRLDENEPLIEEAWRTVCTALTREESWLGALAELLAEGNSANPADDLLGLELQRPHGPTSAARSRIESIRLDPSDSDLAEAIALLLPPIGGRIPENAPRSLLPIFQSVKPLFRSDTAEILKTKEPQFRWLALAAWAMVEETLIEELNERTSLSSLASEPHLKYRGAVLHTKGSPLFQRVITLRALENLELAFIIRFLPKISSQDEPSYLTWLDRERNFFLARDLSYSSALSKALVCTQDTARDQALVRIRDAAQSLGQALDLAGALDLSLDLDRARDLVRAQARVQARHLIKSQDQALVRVQIQDLTSSRALARDRADEWTSAVQRLERSRLWGDEEDEAWKEAALLLSLALAALANAGRLERENPIATRAELEKELLPIRDPEAMAARIEDPAERERTQREWQELLDCPWSPLPLLDELFADKDWDELDLSPESIVEDFAKAVDHLLADYEARNPQHAEQSE